MKIELNFPRIKSKKYELLLLKKIREVLRSGIFLNGEENQTLIRNLQKLLHSKYLVITASGHDSLLLALQSLKLKSDDEIIFPVNAYPTAFPIAQSGSKIVPVDVDRYGLIDIEEVRKKITKKTKVIVVVHLYGLTVNVDKLKDIIEKKKIIIIEDCAQALGSIYKQQPVGTLGDIACFSFYPTKNLGTFGDGGALSTRHKSIYNYFRKAVSYGEDKRYMSEFVSGHSRLSEIQAGILNIYLQNFYKELAKRKRIVRFYQKLFDVYNLLPYIRPLYRDSDSDPALHLLVIEVRNRDRLRVYLSDKGIETHIHYPNPIHLVPAFKFLKHKKGSFPMAERLSQYIISLPFHPYLRESQIEYIIKSLASFYHA